MLAKQSSTQRVNALMKLATMLNMHVKEVIIRANATPHYIFLYVILYDICENNEVQHISSGSGCPVLDQSSAC